MLFIHDISQSELIKKMTNDLSIDYELYSPINGWSSLANGGDIVCIEPRCYVSKNLFRHSFIQAVESLQVFHSAKPGKLTLGQLASGNYSLFPHFIGANYSLQIHPCLPVT